MHNQNKSWFTLVELIVVVTILAILWTIWFVSYNWYLAWVRDTNRTSQLVSIHDWLELYRTRKDLPMPDWVDESSNPVTVKDGSSILWYQWYVWKTVLETIDFTKWWKDPKDWEYFSYYLSNDKKNYQLMAFLEESDNVQFLLWQNLVPQVNAELDFSTDPYEFRYPVVFWKKLWILTNEKNTPIHELGVWNWWLTSSWELVLWSSNTDTFIAYFKNDDNYTSSWSDLTTKIKEKSWY